MAIPTNKAYLTSLFVAEKPSLKDFSMMILLRDIVTSPTPDLLWFVAPSTYTFQGRGPYKEIILIDFPSMLGLSLFSSNEGSVNSATKSART